MAAFTRVRENTRDMMPCRAAFMRDAVHTPPLCCRRRQATLDA